MAIKYITPTGSGNKSGSDWNNAAVIGKLDAMVKLAGPDGTVLIQADAGTYEVASTINLYKGGSDGAPVTIKGVGRNGDDINVQIEGTRPAVYATGNPTGNELFRLNKGADNINFENFTISNTGLAFHVAGDLKNLSITDVTANNVGRFFDDLAGGAEKTATIDGLVIRDVDVNGFSKGVVRLQYDTKNVLIENVVGDSLRQDGDVFAIGLHLDGTAHGVVIRNVQMLNATDTASGKYWNGDGFATERGVYDVRLENTLARGNTDGGYDLKSKSTVLVGAVAEDNARNFRLWGEITLIDPVGLDPHKRGGYGGQFQVQVLKGADVVVKGGAFSDSGGSTTVFAMDGGTINLSKTTITYGKTATFSEGNPIFAITGLNTATINTVASDTGFSTSTTLVRAAVLPSIDSIIRSSGHNETLNGTGAADTFAFDIAAKTGADKIVGFGKNDVVVTSTALPDSNGDGIVTFGKNGVLNLGDGDSIAMASIKKGLRYLGADADGHVYADASVRPVRAVEGTAAADRFAGDKADKTADKFFFDTALERGLGSDQIAGFGARDIIVTTTALSDGAPGSRFNASKGTFQLTDGEHALGSLKIVDPSARGVSVLEFDGAKTVNGVEYFVYSLAGSPAGLADLTV